MVTSCVIHGGLIQIKNTVSGKTTIEIWNNCHHKSSNLLQWMKNQKLAKDTCNPRVK